MDLFSTQVAYAAQSESFNQFIAKVDNFIINPLISFLFALAILYFLYGVFEFLSNQENEEAKTIGKSHMMWGIIGITIMMGVWTILGMLLKTLNINDVKITPDSNEVKLNEYNPIIIPK